MTSAFFSSIRAYNSALGLWTGTPPVRGKTLVGRKVTAGSLLVAKYVPDFDSLVFIYWLRTCSLFRKPRIHCSSLLSYIACLSGYAQYYFVKCRTNYCIEIFTLTWGSHRRTAPSSKIYRGTRHSKSSSKTGGHYSRDPTVVTWVGRIRRSRSFPECPHPSPGFRRLIRVWHRNRAIRYSRIQRKRWSGWERGIW